MTTTVGVSIAIPDPAGRELRCKRASYGDPLAETVPSHITLAPPLEVDRTEVDDLVGRLDAVASSAAPFDVSLRGTDTFRPVSPVVYIHIDSDNTPIEQLAEAVAAAMGCEQQEFPFHPHVTVAHHLPDEMLDHAQADLADFALDFEVRLFHLWVLDDTEGWLPTHEFRLGEPIHS